jgi:hypothetical protein|tara:strand:- start:1047 stop:3152 length:2106 start_codon:yes stop_codon:yes gene_type:complete
MKKLTELVTSTEKPEHKAKRKAITFGSFKRAEDKEVQERKNREHQAELARIAEEGKFARYIADEEQRVIKEENTRKRSEFITGSLSNAFGTKTEVDMSPVREEVIDKYLPQLKEPEKIERPTPFKAEPALNLELEEFKKKINEHLHTVGFMGSGGGGIGDISDAGDVDAGTAKVNGKFLKYDSSSGKFVGADASVNDETIQDTVGAMFSSNTETGITVSYQDADGTIDLVVGTLNQDTTGNAATATALATARNIAGVSFDGTANISLALTNLGISDGSDGQFLKTDGAGSFSFAAPSVSSLAADDISTGDGAVNITTSSGNITIDAAANDSDIILKGTDGGADTDFLTIDGSAAGKATFNNEIVSGAVITSGAGLVIADAGNIGSASDTDAIAIAADGVVTFSQVPVFPNNTVESADIQADAITGAKIADNAINSEHYTDGSIDTAHIADANVTLAKIADAAANTVIVRDANSSGVLSAKAVTNTQILIGDGTGFTAAALSGDVTMTNAGVVTIANTAVETAMIAADAITGAKIADDAINSEHYTDGSIDTAHIAADAVTGAKIADDAINSEHYTDGSIDTAHIASAQVTGPKLGGGVIGAVGFSSTTFDLGTNASGTETLDEANGNFQKGVNGGAHTLAPQSNDSTIVVQYTNNASAGTLTVSGYDTVTGDSLTTTNGHDFLMFSTVIGSFQNLNVVALQ